jgi:cytochrome c biogenesis protein CcmG, thiol:disulfide interchange protein DsbE
MLQAGIAFVFLAFLFAVRQQVREIVIAAGDIAPRFSIVADNGKQISPQDFNGKALLLTFWASWCEPCIAETPALNALARAFEAQGLVVLGVSQDKDLAAYNSFIRNQRPAFLSFRQPDESIQHSYGTFKIPESYLIDRSGTVRAKFISSQDWTSPEIVGQVKALVKPSF